MKRLFLLLLVCPLWGQVATTPTPVCSTYYGVFASYSPNTSPKTTGGGLVATLFPGQKCDGSNKQLYSYTQYIESAARVNGQWTLQQSTTSGVALPIYDLPFGQVWILGTLGAKVTGATGSVGLGTTYGGGISIPIKKWKTVIFPGFQKINSVNVVTLAILRSN